MKQPILLAALLFLVCASSQAQVSHNMTLLGNFHDPSLPSSGGTRYNDVWGWTDCELREYAILGSARYVHFFNLENPASPQQVGFFTGGSTTAWRDMKTFRDRAYSVCDNCSEGLMIFDLSDMPNSVTKTKQTTQFFSSAHNIYIDEAAGRLYVAGSNTKSNGVIILDLNADPDNPTQIGNPTLPGGYIHDIHVRNHIAYGSSGGNGLWVYNLSNPQNPVVLGTLTEYPQSGYNHSSWLSENGQHLVMADETHNKGIKMLDVSDLDDISVIDLFRSALLGPADTASIAHNPFIRDNYVFISYYHDGLQVFNMSNPTNVVKVAWYDTYPANNNYNGFQGCWGVYPFLPSGKILASDMSNGLFILSLNNITLDPIPHPTFPTPTITLNGDNPICQGQTVTINAHPSATDADWYHNGILIQEGGTSIQVGQAGTYHAILYKEYCGIQSNSVNLQVIPLPNPVITPLGATQICQGQSVMLSVDPTATAVHWYRNGFLVQTGGFLFQAQQTGNYHAILFNQSCSVQTNTVQVQVIPYPSSILTLTGDNPICEGETVTLSVDPAATNVQWYLDGALQPWQGTQIEAGVTGFYSAQVYRQNCSVQTNSVFLQVIPLPDPEISPLGSAVICEGGSVTLSADPTATNVVWYRNGALYQTGGSLLEVDQAGTYSAVLFNLFCQIQSNSVVVQVIPLPDPDIALSGENPLCEGESALLSADPTATNVIWFLNGTPLQVVGNPVEVQAAGWYHALVYNQSCSVASDSVELQVIPLPNPVITPLGDPVICEGESVFLSADPSATAVEWFLDGLSLQEEGFTIEAQQAGSYSAILFNQFCEIETNTVLVEVVPIPGTEIALSGDPLICEGESITLSADPGLTSIEWYLDGVLLDWTETQIEVLEEGQYHAILSNQDCTVQSESVDIQLIPYPSPVIALSGDPSLCEGESLTLSADASAEVVAWYLDGELLGESAPQITVQEAGIYYAVLSNQFCQTLTDSVEVEVFPVLDPEISISGDPSLCEGESLLLSVDPAATSVEWYLDGQLLNEEELLIEIQAGGSYYAVLSNPSCTIQTDPVEILVTPYPGSEILVSGESPICEGETLTLSADPAATTVMWYLDGQLLPWEQTQIEVEEAGAYSAVVYNLFCATQAETVEVQVLAAPAAAIGLSDDPAICEGQSLTLNADPSATGIEWYLDGELLPFAEAQIEVQTGGSYYAILSNPACTVQTETVEVEVIPNPAPGIALSGEPLFCEGESVTLSVDPLADAIEWYFDGELLGSGAPQLEVMTGGVYFAILANQACSVQTETVEIQTVPLPNAEIALSGETSFCEGESITLSADPAASSIEWYLDGELLGSQEPELEVQTGGTYYAILSNQACTVQTGPVQIEVVPFPSPEVALSGVTTFCEGGSVTLSVDPLAGVIEWYLDGELLGSGEPQLEATTGGVYFAILSNQACSVQTEPIAVQTIPAPGPEIALSGETSFCEGESITLGADPAATAIEWYLDGELLGSDEPELLVQTGGSYYAILSNGVCTTQTETVEVQVQTAPDPVLIYENTLACQGDSIFLGANPSLDAWQWFLDGEPLEPATGPEWWAGASGEYYYSGALGPCEVKSDPVGITIVAPVVPVLSLANDTLFASPASAYQWYLNGELLEGATGSYFVPQQSGTYTVWTVDPNGCEATSDPYDVEIVNSVSSHLPRGWKIYPNPASDWLTLELPGAGPGSYRLYDLMGRMVINGKITGEKTDIALDRLAAGWYTLEILTGEGRAQLKVVVSKG